MSRRAQADDQGDVCDPRSIKRTRRTKSDIANLKDELEAIVLEFAPATIRQMFYQAVAGGLIDKTETEYKAIMRMLRDMRLEGRLPYSMIADNTRWMRKPQTFSNLYSMLDESARTYRRSVWNDQDVYVEVWLEKEALAGVLYEETEKWDVPLMVCKGYPSLTFLQSAASYMEDLDRPCRLFYFGDYDPSGVDISRNVEQRLRELAPNADITFERIAVNQDDIETLNLPTRPTKKTDSRAKHFKGESVELDAIRPDILRGYVRECIEQLVDHQQLESTRQIEAAERDTLADFHTHLSGGGL